jgi:hypothetical protein
MYVPRNPQIQRLVVLNPFHGLVTKATETINREPFTVEDGNQW